MLEMGEYVCEGLIVNVEGVSSLFNYFESSYE
jgi:hypothetical protein